MAEDRTKELESRLAEYEKADREDRGAGFIAVYVDWRTGRLGISPGNISWQEAEDLLDAVRPEVKRLARMERQQQEQAEVKRQLEERLEAEIAKRMAERAQGDGA